MARVGAMAAGVLAAALGAVVAVAQRRLRRDHTATASHRRRQVPVDTAPNTGLPASTDGSQP